MCSRPRPDKNSIRRSLFRCGHSRVSYRIKKVIVIGAGIGGLGTAGLFAKKGYDVTVLEKNENLGGHAKFLRLTVFDFDMGPSWYLAPDLFEHYFELMGERVDDHLSTGKALAVVPHLFREGSEPLDIHSDIERDAATFEAIEPGAATVKGLPEAVRISVWCRDAAFHVQKLRHDIRFSE